MQFAALRGSFDILGKCTCITAHVHYSTLRVSMANEDQNSMKMLAIESHLSCCCSLIVVSVITLIKRMGGLSQMIDDLCSIAIPMVSVHAKPLSIGDAGYG